MHSKLVAAARAGELDELQTGHSNKVFDAGDLVVKRFKSQARSEPQREWAALQMLGLEHPGLAPRAVQVDYAEPACLVTERVDGRPLELADMVPRGRVVAAVSAVHAALASIGPGWGRELPIALTHPWILLWRARTGIERALEASVPSDRTALDAARRWLATEEAESVGRCTRQALSRGDPKLANYLWDGDRLIALDFEDSGWSDPRQDVAELAEHQASWGMDAAVWHEVAGAIGVDPLGPEVTASRRAMACFWLAALIPHEVARADGRVDSQIARTLGLLG